MKVKISTIKNNILNNNLSLSKYVCLKGNLIYNNLENWIYNNHTQEVQLIVCIKANIDMIF